MAQGSSSLTISQRIALEGDEDIKKRLAELGSVGEKEFQRIAAASEASGSRLSGVSNVMASIRTNVASVSTSFAPVITQFGHLHESAKKFGESLSHVSEHVFPNFKEVIALGTAAGVAGLVQFISTGARAAKDIGDLSSALGINIISFQAFKGAAAAAGIEGNKFEAMMSRFAVKATEAGKTQLNVFGDLAKQLTGNISTMGVNVLRGQQKAIDSSIGLVIRGGQGMAAAAGAATIDIDSRITKGFADGNSEIHKKFMETAEILKAVMVSSGIAVNQTTGQMAKNLSDISAKGGDAGEKIRKMMSEIGVQLPSQNAFEAVDRYLKSWDHDLSRVVTMWKVVGNEVQPKTLEEAFRETADRVKQMGVGIQQTAFIRQNFGRDALRMTEILKGGSAGIEDIIERFTELGIAISPAESAIGSKLVIAFEHLENAISNTRTMLAIGLAPALEPIAEMFTHAIAGMSGSIREWAADVANQLVPGLTELAHIMEHGTHGVEVQSEWVKTLIKTWDGIAQTGRMVAGAFRILIGVLDHVADALNYVFDTKFTGGTLLAILAIGRVTGAFGLLSAAAALALDAFMLFVTKPLVFLIEMAAKMGLIRAATVAIQTAFLATVEFFSAGSMVSLFAPLLAAIGPVGWVILALAAIAAALITWMGGWDAVFKFLGEGWDNLKATVGAFIEMVKSAATALARLFSMGGGASTAGAGGYEAGGPIVGPRGRDRVPIWATAGEWVMREAAVSKYGLGIMSAINSLTFPAPALAAAGPISSLPPPSLRFAEGGLIPSVGSQGPGSTLNLSIGTEVFEGLFAPRAVADKILRYSRSREVASAGRKPGHFTG